MCGIVNEMVKCLWHKKCVSHNSRQTDRRTERIWEWMSARLKFLFLILNMSMPFVAPIFMVFRIITAAAAVAVVTISTHSHQSQSGLGVCVCVWCTSVMVRTHAITIVARIP